jgi:hypothetical protein
MNRNTNSSSLLQRRPWQVASFLSTRISHCVPLSTVRRQCFLSRLLRHFFVDIFPRFEIVVLKLPFAEELSARNCLVRTEENSQLGTDIQSRTQMCVTRRAISKCLPQPTCSRYRQAVWVSRCHNSVSFRDTRTPVFTNRHPAVSPRTIRIRITNAALQPDPSPNLFILNPSTRQPDL